MRGIKERASTHLDDFAVLEGAASPHREPPANPWRESPDSLPSLRPELSEVQDPSDPQLQGLITSGSTKFRPNPHREARYEPPPPHQYFTCTALLLDCLSREAIADPSGRGVSGVSVVDTILLHDGRAKALYTMEEGRVTACHSKSHNPGAGAADAPASASSWLYSHQFFPHFNERAQIGLDHPRAILTDVSSGRTTNAVLRMHDLRRLAESERWGKMSGFLQRTGGSEWLTSGLGGPPCELHLVWDAGGSRGGTSGLMYCMEPIAVPLAVPQLEALGALCDRIVRWCREQQLGSVDRLCLTMWLDRELTPWVVGCSELLWAGHPPYSQWGAVRSSWANQVREKQQEKLKKKRSQRRAHAAAAQAAREHFTAGSREEEAGRGARGGDQDDDAAEYHDFEDDSSNNSRDSVLPPAVGGGWRGSHDESGLLLRYEMMERRMRAPIKAKVTVAHSRLQCMGGWRMLCCSCLI